MGLLDVLNGMQNGPRGAQNPAAARQGMSPITMAILGLLAYKAVKSLGAQSPTSPSAPAGAPNANTGGLGGLLQGGLFQGGLGGLLAGAGAGSILSGGLNDLINKFQQNGLGDIAKSWVGTGQNQPVSPDQLEKVLGPDQIQALTAQTGLSRDDLLTALAQHLPNAIDHLTPEGRIPTAQEAASAL